MNFTDLRRNHTEARANLDAAQAAERDARRGYSAAGTDLAKALYEHVQPLYVKDEVRKTEALGEVQIVAIRVEVYDPTTVKAVYVIRTKAGAWGKTRTTSQKLVWDFERGDWTGC